MFADFFLSCIALSATILASCTSGAKKQEAQPVRLWRGPDTTKIPDNDFGALVHYGHALVVNTAHYIGPEGIVSHQLGNFMSCTNCHLDAGTRPYGINFFSTHARYPQYRAREDAVLTLADRINNCIERPHNGTPLPPGSRELRAIESYIKWLGKGVPVDSRVPGDSPIDIPLIARAADPERGEKIYRIECESCHGSNGEGKMKSDGRGYEYPPLWGPQSYQPGSSMHRVHKAAAFIYANMPDKKAYPGPPYLSAEDAYDVAAFINDDRIHARPGVPAHAKNYPNPHSKPIDYGTGPFIDTFSAGQHKFGPWQPIIDYRKSHNQHFAF